MGAFAEPLDRVSPEAEIRRDLLRPLEGFSFGYLAAVGFSGAVVAWALVAWGYQIYYGIGVAGIRRPVFWGFYIINFVFWIGISHAGTLISAILRLTDAGWRKPVTRAAEAITVSCLMIGGLFPLIHLGRVWLFYWLIPYPNERMLWPNFRSPLVWDMTAIFTYMTGSVLFLYLPMIPDLAMMSHRTSGVRSFVYRALSLGWTGSDRQWHAIERAMKLMAGMILAVAVSVHSVVAFDFSMSIAPMWHSTIFRALFRGRSDSQRHCRAGVGDGGPAAFLEAASLLAAVSFRQSRQAVAADVARLALLHLRRAPYRLVRQQSRRDCGVQRPRTWRILDRAVDDDYLQLRDSLHAAEHSKAAQHHDDLLLGSDGFKSGCGSSAF